MLKPKRDIQNGPREREMKVDFGNELWKKQIFVQLF